jgi:hypothetical protein
MGPFLHVFIFQEQGIANYRLVAPLQASADQLSRWAEQRIDQHASVNDYNIIHA